MPDAPKAANGCRRKPRRRRGPAPPHCTVRFTRDSRLSRKSDFDRVFSQARVRTRRGPLRALACDNDLARPRLGLIVGRRHARRAVDRNRIKRQIRESFRTHAADLPACDVVVQLIDQPTGRDLGGPLKALWRGVCEGWCERSGVRGGAER